MSKPLTVVAAVAALLALPSAVAAIPRGMRSPTGCLCYRFARHFTRSPHAQRIFDRKWRQVYPPTVLSPARARAAERARKIIK